MHCLDQVLSSFGMLMILWIAIMLQDFKIQNVVASCDVKFPIRLEGLAFSHGLFCSVSAALAPHIHRCAASCNLLAGKGDYHSR